MRKSDISNDEDIKELVHTFYDRIQRDERLGYIFNEAAGVDWDKHLPRMVDFWSNLIFQTNRYRGRPFRQHLPLPIKRGDFERWFGIWSRTVDEMFEGKNADHAREMAAKIASSFSLRLEMEGKFEES
ncbi:MAG TPA: group III truncated hemoglobin [Halalkalibaculum sp.]|nr:group III truncated hemoglobin [Halalkalibaculum sp.]